MHIQLFEDFIGENAFNNFSPEEKKAWKRAENKIGDTYFIPSDETEYRRMMQFLGSKNWRFWNTEDIPGFSSDNIDPNKLPAWKPGIGFRLGGTRTGHTYVIPTEIKATTQGAKFGYDEFSKLFEDFTSESYDGNLSDFRYEFPLHFENVTGNNPNAIKKIEKKGKGYEVRTSTYMSEPEMKAVGDEMGLKLVSYQKSTMVAITVYESFEDFHEEKVKEALNEDIYPKSKGGPIENSLRAEEIDRADLFVNGNIIGTLLVWMRPSYELGGRGYDDSKWEVGASYTSYPMSGRGSTGTGVWSADQTLSKEAAIKAGKEFLKAVKLR